MTIQAYRSGQRKPNMATSYCLFLDLLGYKQLIKQAAQGGAEQSELLRFYNEVVPEIKRMVPSRAAKANSYRHWDAKVFTDSVVLGYAVLTPQLQRQSIVHVLDQILTFQFNLALKGYFVRGGWTLGKLFMDPNTVFGSAMIDAYELESKVAIYPRIVLSSNMKSYIVALEKQRQDLPLRQHFLLDSKGLMFTNYLDCIVDDTGSDRSFDWLALSKHGRSIEGKLKEYRGNCTVCEKFRWLAAYHNYFCNLVKGGKGYKADFKVQSGAGRYKFLQI